MTSLLVASIALAAAGLTPAASTPARRFAVVVGSNHGADGRIPLRYAVSDAEHFAGVLTRMGGVRTEDGVVLREPTRRAFLDALAAMGVRAEAARKNAARVDLLVYFSGHADEQGLMLGREHLSYRELRAAVGEITKDVGITVLDACASGAITRLKGGAVYPAFLTDVSSSVQGYAFLTSSSATEAAQESDRLQGSFFTHALLTGLRGAADMSGDGRVTLGEAYQFAFNETLAQTTTTQAGAQHPMYDIKMSGTGDVVMTDVAQTSCRLVLGNEYEGRFFVIDSGRHLVAELYKKLGRTIELGLEPGLYDLYFEQERRLLTASLRLEDGQRRELASDGLRPTRRVPTRIRGRVSEEPLRGDLLHGRTRFQVLRGVMVSHWLTPALAVDVSTRAMTGARLYPPVRGAIRPYAATGIGRASAVGGIGDPLGLGVGGGVDIFFGRHLSVSLDSTYAVAKRQRPRLEANVGIGWSVGQGRRR